MSTWSPPPADVACYRHPKVQSPVTCNLCNRPICADCMISAPVGWQCPSCVKGAPPVRRMRDIQAGGVLVGQRPYLTYALMAACVAVFVAQWIVPGFEDRYVIIGTEVAGGEWWRVLSSGFLHGGPIHIVFNMLVLFQVGSALEARLGRVRFGALYLLSLIGGSIGVLLLHPPETQALGASGAVFGLMGAVVVLPSRGRSPIESSVGGLLLINLVLTFVIPGIAIGGHLGGLAAGALGGVVIRGIGLKSELKVIAATTAVLAVLAAGLFVAARPAAEWRCAQESGEELSFNAARARALGLDTCP